MTEVSERATKRPRRVGRVILTVTLSVVFAVGIVALMMVLAGAFEPKVKVRPGRVANASANAKARADRPVGVVKRIRRPRRESAVGTIRAVNEAVVASKILARVEEVRARAGQDVKQGDVLVVLDSANLKAKMEQALAEERATRAKFDQAEIDLGRSERLRARESITQSDLDQASTAMRTARAERERAQRAVEEARIVESYAIVRAPISGRVIDKKVNPGDTVSPGQMMVTMYDPIHMQMIATVRESLALRLKVGQHVPARLDTFGYDCLATISEIVPEAQVESRSFQVKLTGPCPPNVYGGMFGRIFIPLEDEDVLIVPKEAVRQVGQLDEVDVVEGDSLSRRAVQLGRTFDEGREVLSGLKDGEKVVLLRGGAEPSGSDRS